MPLDCTLVKTARETPTLVIAREDSDPEKRRALEAQGVEVLAAASSGTHVDLKAALTALAARGVTRLFVEGGLTLADALANADLIDRVITITNAKALNDAGIRAMGPALEKALSGAHHLVEFENALWGQDRMVAYRRATR